MILASLGGWSQIPDCGDMGSPLTLEQGCQHMAQGLLTGLPQGPEWPGDSFGKHENDIKNINKQKLLAFFFTGGMFYG